MRWRAYPNYRATGIQWLNSVPTQWELMKLKYISRTQFSSVDKHIIEGEATVRLCNYVDVYKNDFITSDLCFMEATATPAEITRYELRRGDVIITKDSESWNDIAVAAFVPDGLNTTICGYHLAQIRPNSKILDGRYLFRLFQARGLNDQFQVASTGVTRYGLGKHSLDSGIFPLPTLTEQKKIADFLDRETERIDALIIKKQRQIELLNEKRAALISHAVTKGLNPNARMKNSAIEWLGAIPEGWQTRRGKFLFQKIDLQPEEDDGIVTAFRDGQVTLRENRRTEGYTFAIQELGYQRVRLGDLVIHGMDAFAGAVGVSESTGKCTPEYVVLTPAIDGVNNDFFAYCLRVMAKRNYIYCICPSVRERAPRFRFERFKEVLFPLPPPAEQESIVSHLQSQMLSLDSFVKKTNQSITVLQEYRTALITAAVTGKIDVRQEASHARTAH